MSQDDFHVDRLLVFAPLAGTSCAVLSGKMSARACLSVLRPGTQKPCPAERSPLLWGFRGATYGRMRGRPVMCRKDKKQPGPEPERLKIEGDWEEAIKQGLKAPPPPKDKKKGDKPARNRD